MKNFLTRLLLATVAVFIGLALASSAHGQQADRTSNPQAQSTNMQPYLSSEEPETMDAHSFTGRVVRENGRFILNDVVTKVIYQFDDPSKAKRYFGKQVKVTGKLGLDSNTIHIENIQPLS